MPLSATPTQVHVDRLALASYAIAALIALVGLVIISVFAARGLVGQLNGDFPDNTGFYGAAAAFVASIALTALAVATGLGLKRRRAWARTTGLITGALTVLSFPFGTAYGVYAFWVLTRPQAREVLT